MTTAETTSRGGWAKTEEAFIEQLGEGRQAQYRVKIGQRVEPLGQGDEAFITGARVRDEMVRELSLSGEDVKPLPEEVLPPAPGEPTMAPVRFVELLDGNRALIRLGDHETEISFDLLRRA